MVCVVMERGTHRACSATEWQLACSHAADQQTVKSRRAGWDVRNTLYERAALYRCHNIADVLDVTAVIGWEHREDWTI